MTKSRRRRVDRRAGGRNPETGHERPAHRASAGAPCSDRRHRSERAGPGRYPDLGVEAPVRIRTPDEGGDGYEVDQKRKKQQKLREKKVDEQKVEG